MRQADRCQTGKEYKLSSESVAVRRQVSFSRSKTIQQSNLYSSLTVSLFITKLFAATLVRRISNPTISEDDYETLHLHGSTSMCGEFRLSLHSILATVETFDLGI